MKSPGSLQPREKWEPLGGSWGQRRVRACLLVDHLGVVGWCKAFVSELPTQAGPGDIGYHLSPGAAPREEVCPWLMHSRWADGRGSSTPCAA